MTPRSSCWQSGVVFPPQNQGSVAVPAGVEESEQPEVSPGAGRGLRGCSPWEKPFGSGSSSNPAELANSGLHGGCWSAAPLDGGVYTCSAQAFHLLGCLVIISHIGQGHLPNGGFQGAGTP